VDGARDALFAAARQTRAQAAEVEEKGFLEPEPVERAEPVVAPEPEPVVEPEIEAAAEPEETKLPPPPPDAAEAVVVPEPAGDEVRVERVVDRVQQAREQMASEGSSPADIERPEPKKLEKEGEAADEEAESPRFTAEEMLGPAKRKPTNLLGPQRSDDAGPARAKVISFANQKGGVAKTTTTLNLAVALKEMGNDVLCVDLDPQGNLTMSQGIDPDYVEKSMYDVLIGKAAISEIIQHCEIDVAVSSIDLAGAEIAMSTMIGRERSLEKALAEVKDDYDFICMDTPPSLGLLTINALTASDKVIVPVQCEYLSMRGLVQLQNTLEMIRENLNPGVEIEGILPTMYDARTLHAREAVEILEENFGDLVFKTRIRKAIKFAEAPVRGSSVLKYDPEGVAASYYRELAQEVLAGVRV
jgi:chromosome partitioning protein